MLPGPFLSLLFADLGADVIKVEPVRGGDWVRYMPPQHEGVSVAFAALNRGKRSVTLDLKKPGGVEVLEALVRTADILVESFRPGVMDRLGVGWERLHAINPRLIYCAITGYGQTGPMSMRAGHDLNYVGLSGALALTGDAGGGPQLPGFQLADVAGGGLFGAVGILSALHARGQTGEGRFVDISMTEGALAFTAMTLAQALGGGPVPRRGTDQLNGGVACYQVYETSDGKHLSVAPLEPKFWAAFCEAVERPDWLKRHMGDDEAMKAEISALIRTRTRAQWESVFAGVDACVEPVLELDELQDHPQHQARQIFFDLQQGPSPLRQARNPLLSPEDAAASTPAPALGADTLTVLQEAGLSEEDIRGLASRGVVSGLS